MVKYTTKSQHQLHKISHSKRVTNILNFIAFLLFLWIVFYPYPAKLAIVSGLLFPIILVITIPKRYSLVRIIDWHNERSPYPSISAALILPHMGILIRLATFEHLKVLDYTNAQIYTVIFVPFLLYFLIKRAFLDYSYLTITKRILRVIAHLILMIVFIYYDIIVVNCLFDYSQPTISSSTIVDKQIIEKDETEYFIYLDKIDTLKFYEEVHVPKSVYYELKVSQEVSIHLKKGLFYIPWIQIILQEE